MTANHNHANYQSRLNYIQQLLVDQLHLPSNDLLQTKITPIQYEPDCPFKYNNFVYHLVLPSASLGGPVNADAGPQLQQPGCVDIPTGTREFILRLSNPDAEGMHQETRVQNEVAMLALAAQALHHVNPTVVPRVFGWGAASSKQVGWILQELMPGVALGEAFEAMSLDQKRGIMTQMAGLLKALQDYPLPESIHGFGGAMFDDRGAIVSGPMTIVGAGPWDTFEDSYRGRLKVALAQADGNPYIKGWHANGIRERVDAFVKHGLPSVFSSFSTTREKTIIHGDFTTDNLLYDPTTGHVTALLDYDFASILHPAYEFFRSFGSNGGQLSGWSGDTTPQEIEAEALRKAKLTAVFPSTLPAPGASGNGSEIDWEIAQAWEEELQKLDVKRPSTIPGIEQLADIDELLGALLPWTLSNGDFLSLKKNRDEDRRMALRRMSEEKLAGLLDHLGF